MVSLADAQAIEADIAEAADRLNARIADAHARGFDIDIDAMPAGWNGARTLVTQGPGICAPKVAVEVRASPCSLSA
ncbi:MAG: hypothetical protein AB7P02_05085 [Alphaproteobacteria bacterium]